MNTKQTKYTVEYVNHHGLKNLVVTRPDEDGHTVIGTRTWNDSRTPRTVAEYLGVRMVGRQRVLPGGMRAWGGTDARHLPADWNK